MLLGVLFYLIITVQERFSKLFSPHKQSGDSKLLVNASPGLAEEIEEKYVRKDVWLEREKRIDERCEREGEQIKALIENQKATDRKITASLVFGIITLISIIVAIASRALI
jgi:hypothetical protein